LTVLERILREKRTYVVALAVGLVANLAVYLLLVHPLSTNVSGAELRRERAEGNLRAAERAHKAAQATVTGLERAKADLQRFYRDVLPRDLSAAGRMTYLHLAQLARDANLRYERRTFSAEQVRDSKLDVLKMSMVLEGSYEDIRRFIYRLETTPDFVVLDQVALGPGRDAEGSLVLNLELSTYFRAVGDAR
jgi:Tfp pilus assembly protein PilO